MTPNQTSALKKTIAALIEDVSMDLDRTTKLVGCSELLPPRYTLFHAANSICSQKVRAVLAHHRCEYLSHEMSIVAGHTYLPSYVRLRLIGCASAELPLVTTHRGSTAASKFGCDPAVVPTLVDLLAGEVVVDSKVICRRIDADFPEKQRLWPTALADAIDAEIDIVDALPNYQMLVGGLGDDDCRPAGLRAQDGATFSMAKVARCDAQIATHSGVPDLIAAFGAKRAKELHAAQTLFSLDNVRQAHDTVRRACETLDDRLRVAVPWLFGSCPTMADLFWVIALLRMENLGADGFWAGGRLPRVEELLRKGRRLFAVRIAVVEYPGAYW